MFKSELFTYDELKAEAAARYPVAVESLGKDTDPVLAGKDLDPALTDAEKARWEWENVLSRVEKDLLSEAAKTDGLDFENQNISEILIRFHLRIKKLEGK